MKKLHLIQQFYATFPFYRFYYIPKFLGFYKVFYTFQKFDVVHCESNTKSYEY